MAADKIKGSHHRLITVPGYHIHPQFDLKHTRHLLHERRAKKAGFTLSLAPMVDMFSILVIYLLMNFASDGEAFFVSQDIVIPHAARGAPMKSLPLISVAKGKISFDAQNPDGTTMSVSEPNDSEALRLRETLKSLKKVEEQIGEKADLKTQVNVQADEKAPMEDVKKVMRVLVEEGWTGINFIVDPASAKGAAARAE